MRLVVLVGGLALALGAAGCRVCMGACEKQHGRVVTGVVPRADGTMVVTTCDLTTKGNGASVSRCRGVEIGAADGSSPAAGAAAEGGAP